MKRGDVFLVARTGPQDPKRIRPFVVVSRQGLLDSRYSTVMCAPVYSAYGGSSTELAVGEAEGLKHPSGLRCDEVTSLPRSALTNYVGELDQRRFGELNRALAIALDIDPDDVEDL
ncbi:MAG: type II toxin-antitoxin system PemK/MazF family toxin [Tepidiformaceae bacterium]